MSKSRSTNLDENATEVYFGNSKSDLEANDNAGLGYARAVKVAKELKDLPELSEYTILPYSGGPLILRSEEITSGAIIKDDPSRRRIEIRVRRSSSQK